MPQLERDIEKYVAEYAQTKGCMSLHLNVLGRIGWPDRIFLYPKGRILFIEFKLPGEKPRKIQVYIISRLIAYGFKVEVVDSITDGKRCIDQLIGWEYEA